MLLSLRDGVGVSVISSVEIKIAQPRMKHDDLMRTHFTVIHQMFCRICKFCMNNGKFIKTFSDNWPLCDDGGGEQTIGTSGSVIQAGACQIVGR
ncbi:conserved hypothetical protein [Trichinella spiralis]|uniref:hypothetical protein n=1 Tax=Trichinella spiralis TaxID=6334 RepID=UPI0001EFC37D|nr:conserved hypothetical protein [Trichinella spiralis]